MIVLSLFDGMSGGQLALKQANIKVDNYYASEIDKFAIQVTQHNFPNTIQIGDITKINLSELPKFDLIIGGSPCTGFSFAGKQLNFEDPQSKLFFDYVRLLNEIREYNPNVLFFLENVNMKKAYIRVISEYLGIFPVNINSNLLTAQNRNRWYWTNIKTKKVGLFEDLYVDIPQPKDKGILLKDILQPESEIDSKYYLSDKAIKGVLNHSALQKEKGNWFGAKLHTEQDKCNALKVGGKGVDDIIKISKKGNKKADQNKSWCLTTGGHSGGNHSDMDILCVAMRGCNPNNSNDRTPGSPTKQRLEAKTDGKTNCLTSVSKDKIIFTKNYVQWDTSGKGYKSQQDRAFYVDGKHGALADAIAESKNGILTEDFKLRRLTPIECERLQGVPDNYTNVVSDSQRYKMLGNGWTIPIISHIFSFI